MDAPLAITTDGTVVANVTHVLAEVGDDPQELLASALKTARPVFIGVALDGAEVADAVKRVDNAATEIVAMVVKA